MAIRATLRAARNAADFAAPGRPSDPIQRHAAIHNALSMALHFVHQSGATPAEDRANLWAATARTNRALTLLKAANAEAGLGGGV